MTRRWRLAAAALGLAALLAAAPSALGLRVLESPGAARPADAYALLDAALRAHVRAGRVDYLTLQKHRASLDDFVATLASWGPRTAPSAFPDAAHRLAYYLNAYNALVLFAVLESGPISSVHDVRGWLEPQPGFGFFWSQWFVLDGAHTNLYRLEHDVLRARFADARVHAALNCASASCPKLRGEPYRAARLQTQLNEAARHLASDPPHVRVDDAARQLELSAIYRWFSDDFADHAARLGAGDTVLDWLTHYASPPVRQALTRARAGGYAVRYLPYDWSLNQAAHPAALTPGSPAASAANGARRRATRSR